MTARSARRDVLLLFAALGTFFLSISMLMPTLPLYVQDLGGSPVEVGLVVGMFSLGVLAVRPWVGRRVDTRGRRPVMVLGAIVAGVLAPLYAVFTGFLALVAVRLLHGAGLSAFTSASTTLATDLAPPERRTAFLGYLSTASIVSFAIGPMIGLELAERAGYATLFATIGAFALLSAGCGALMSPPRRNDDANATPVDYRRAIMRPEVLIPTATLLLTTLAHGGVFTFLPILLAQRLTFNFGLFFLSYAGASLVVRLAAGSISRRWGDGPMIWGGLAVYAVGLALLPLIRGPVTMVVAALFMGVGFGTYQPAVYGLVANAATDRNRGMVFSVFLGAFDLGMSAGGLAAGPIVAWAGIPALLYALAVVPVIAASLFVARLGWNPDPSACPLDVPHEAAVP